MEVKLNSQNPVMDRTESLDYPSNEKNKEPRSNGYYLAMFAFGMSNFLMGTYMIRAIAFDAAVLSQGFVFAGIAQLYGGITSFFDGNTIGSWISMMFGIWWQSLVGATIIPEIFPSSKLDNVLEKGVWFNMVWLTFLVIAEILLLSTWKKDAVSPSACVFVITTCILVAVNTGNPNNREWAIRGAGVTAMASGVLGFYAGAASFINFMFDRSVLPLGFST